MMSAPDLSLVLKKRGIYIERDISSCVELPNGHVVALMRLLSASAASALNRLLSQLLNILVCCN